MARTERHTGGHAGHANKDKKPYLSHVPEDAMHSMNNNKHSNHPSNNMSHTNLESVKGGNMASHEMDEDGE